LESSISLIEKVSIYEFIQFQSLTKSAFKVFKDKNFDLNNSAPNLNVKATFREKITVA
jgi:hypothetical protein